MRACVCVCVRARVCGGTCVCAGVRVCAQGRVCVCGGACVRACVCVWVLHVGLAPAHLPFLGLEQLQTGLVPGTLMRGGLLQRVMELGCIPQTHPQPQGWMHRSP